MAQPKIFNFLEYMAEDTIPIDTTGADISNQKIKEITNTLIDSNILNSQFMTPEAYTALEFQAEDALDLAGEQTERYNTAVKDYTDIKKKYNADMDEILGLQKEQAELYKSLIYAESLAYPDVLAKMFGSRNDKLEKRYLDIRNAYNSIGLGIKKIDDYWHKTPRDTGGGGYGLGQVATPGHRIPAIRKLSKIDAANEIFNSLDKLKDTALESTELGGGKLPEGIKLSETEVSMIEELDPDFDIDHLISFPLQLQPSVIKDIEQYSWGTTTKKLKKEIDAIESSLKFHQKGLGSGNLGKRKMYIDWSKEFGVSTGLISFKNKTQIRKADLEKEYNKKINLYNKIIKAN